MPPVVIPPVPLQAQDPSKPWVDGESQSQGNVVPVVRLQIFDTACPAFGFETSFNVGDLPRSERAIISVIAGVAGDTKSLAVNAGFQRCFVYPFFSDPTATCTINFYVVIAGVDTLVRTWTGVNRLTTGLFVGGQDQYFIDGQPIKIEVLSISSGQVSVSIEGH